MMARPPVRRVRRAMLMTEATPGSRQIGPWRERVKPHVSFDVIRSRRPTAARVPPRFPQPGTSEFERTANLGNLRAILALWGWWRSARHARSMRADWQAP